MKVTDAFNGMVATTNSIIASLSNIQSYIGLANDTSADTLTGRISRLENTTDDLLRWEDLEGDFALAKGIGRHYREPRFEDCGNGLYHQSFKKHGGVFMNYHVPHNYKENTLAFPHIHFFCQESQPSGKQVEWTFSYVVAKGYGQRESMTDATTEIKLVYTYTGDEVPGEHIILEADDMNGISLKEPDSLVSANIILSNETVYGKIFGVKCDIHYLSTGRGTIGKRPDFNEAD